MSVTLENIGISMSSSTPSSLLDGLMTWWSCNELSNAIVYDAHTTNIDSFLQVFTGGIAGKIGNCLRFDGLSNYVSFGNACRPTSAISIAFWFKSSYSGADQLIVCNHAWSTNWYGYNVTLNTSGQIFFNLFSGTATMLQDKASSTGYANGLWHHCVCTWNGTIAYLYLDNIKTTGTNYSTAIAYNINCNLHIGSNEEHTVSWFNGDFDLGGIYNKALSDSEVALLYASGSALDYPF